MYISKKTLLTVLSVILVLSLVVGGTLAYLQDTSVKVENDFTKNEVRVDLYETADENSDTHLDSKSYSILPDTSAFKNPTVEVKNTVPAYVFVQATGNTKNMITWKIDDNAGWLPLTGVANVWYREVAAQTSGDSTELNVIKGKTVSYSKDITNETIADDNLDFQAFAIQKEPANDPAKAWVLLSTGVLADTTVSVPGGGTKADNSSALATAITDALADSDTDSVAVVVGEGEYTLPAGLTEGKVSIIGNGADNTKLDISNYTSGAPMSATISDAKIVNSNAGSWTPSVVNLITDGMVFKNCVIDSSASGSVNAVYQGTINGDLLFENCTIKAATYGVNFSNVNGTLTLRNCDITGWNSFGGASNPTLTSEVIIDNCTFHHSGTYGSVRFYQNATVTGCTFDENVWLDVNKDGVTVKINNCSGLETDEIFLNNSAFTDVHFFVDGTELTGVSVH